jgi:hypothetical protein
MSKEKLNLSDFQIQSFVTSLDQHQLEQTKGGLQLNIQGKKTNYSTRWTSVDTRIDNVEGKSTPIKGKQV